MCVEKNVSQVGFQEIECVHAQGKGRTAMFQFGVVRGKENCKLG